MEQSASAEIQEKANALIINVNEISESQREAYSPCGNESQDGEVARRAKLRNAVLANDIELMLERLEPPLSPKCCIYRVPHELRKLNDEAYTPKVISIGPFHCDNKRLKAMETFKMRYFKRFVQLVKLDVENLVSIIRNIEGDIRRCYAETSKLSSDNYVKMILVDASFIIAFFLDSVLDSEKKEKEDVEWSTDDSSTAQHAKLSIDDSSTAFTRQLMCSAIEDMWLLENQLPFFVMEELYNLAFPTCLKYPASFNLLTFKFIKLADNQGISLHVPVANPNWKILHLCDLLRTIFLPPSNKLPETYQRYETRNWHTASQLDEAGVKFKEGSSQCLFDLKFTKGELEIPRLNLWATTESFFRNLMAFEQCYYLNNTYVADYIILLDLLIDTAKDVDLLVHEGILNNTLGDSNAVMTMFNNLSQQNLALGTNSSYYGIYEGLDTFYKRPWHRWKATLRRDYLSTPWRTASTVAAIILLVLTFIQTIRSFY